MAVREQERSFTEVVCVAAHKYAGSPERANIKSKHDCFLVSFDIVKIVEVMLDKVGKNRCKT